MCKKRRGRPRSGNDPVIPVRLPEKLVRHIDEWAQSYRDQYTGMSRSTAIRCLIRLGLDQVALQVVDPKDRTVFEGETQALLRFTARAARSWSRKGKIAERRPPLPPP